MNNKLKYFLGKVCTILTQQANIQFKDFVQHAQYFTGEVIDFDENGIWLKHPQTKALSFFSFPVLGIIEEQTIAANDPLMDKIKEDIKKKTAPKPVSNLIPVEDLTKMIKKRNNIA